MKTLSRTFLALYVIILLWLVLFKLTFDIVGVLTNLQMRTLNLIPLAGAHLSEMIANIVVFIPFGLLLSVNFRRVSFRQKLAVVLSFSIVIETLQYVLAIGRTDITDVITNTLGGFIGLMLYDLSSKYIDRENQDRFIVVVGASLLAMLVLLRVLVLRVKY